MDKYPSNFNIFAVSNSELCFPLHLCALNTTRLEVLQMVIDMYPHALTVLTVSANHGCHSPVDFANNNRYRSSSATADIVRILDENTARYLNLQNQIAVKCCVQRIKNEGLTDSILATPLNDLLPPQFAFRVIDEMMRCEWQPQAEYIVSLVGTNIGLSSD